MNISTWSIRHPVPPIALFLVLCVVGLFAFKQLSITKFPNIDIPIITITIAQPGAAPSELITQISKPVEVFTSDDCRNQTHYFSCYGFTFSTTIEFELNTDSDKALNEVKDEIAKIRSSLPQSITEPIIQRLDVTGIPIMTFAVTDPNA